MTALVAGDGQRDDGVEDAEVDVGGNHRERGSGKQRGEDQCVLRRGDDVMRGVLRVGDVAGIVEVLLGFCHAVLLIAARG